MNSHLCTRFWLLALLLHGQLIAAESPDAAHSAGDLHERGVQFHLQRRLDEASHEYARVLSLEPPRSPTPSEFAVIRRFAPRMYLVRSDPFGLKDIAAVMHPSQRWIAYHLFWEDDIDFPEDNDPCDHEVVWIQYSVDLQKVERICTYYHDHLLDGGALALDDARRHGQRARINVQWGKHGSLPLGWEQLQLSAENDSSNASSPTFPGANSVFTDNYKTWQRLSTQGRRLIDNPIARRLEWPETYSGSFQSYTNYSKQINPVLLLEQRRMVMVSRWNSAVINRYFLLYNFRPKTEWPTRW